MKESVAILPTGTCFEDVTLMFVQMLREDPRRLRGQFYMVHGICQFSDGRDYSHAWIEEGEHTHFPGILDGKMGFIETWTVQFHKQFRVREYTRYTAIEARERAIAAGNVPPPWELKYLRLCRDWAAK